MEDEIKFWILLSISEGGKKRGVSYKSLSLSTPNFISKPGDLMDALSELRKENLIELNEELLDFHYKLTKEGSKVLHKYFTFSHFVKYMNLIKSVPQFELRYRMRVIEGFLASLLLLILFSSLYYFFQNYLITKPYLLLSLASIMMFLFSSSVAYGILLLTNYVYNLIRSISTRLAELIEECGRYLVVATIVLSIVGSMILFVLWTEYTFIDMIYTVLGGIVIFVMTNFKKVKAFLEGLLEKFSKKSTE